MLFVAAISLNSCEDKAYETESSGLSKRKIEITTNIDIQKTRGQITDTNFPTYCTYGIVITKHDEIGTPFNLGSENIYAFKIRSWNYRYTNSSVYSPDIYIIQNKKGDNSTADFYGYAPWTSYISDENSGNRVFNLNTGEQGGQPDIMWAKENDGSHGCNNNISTGIGDTYPAGTYNVKFNFQHKLAALVFKFEKSVKGNDENPNLGDPEINAIAIEPVEGKRIATVVNLNIKTGELGALEFSESLRLRYREKLTDSGIQNWMLIYPEEMSDLSDNDPVYYVTFTIDNCELDQKFKILKKHLIENDGTCGFKPGKKYIFTFEVDNHVHLKGISIDEDWKNTDEETIIV